MSAREKFQQAANLIDAEQRMKKSMWGQFWSAHQRFFKYLCIASKVRRVVQLAREEVQNGKVGLDMNIRLLIFLSLFDHLVSVLVLFWLNWQVPLIRCHSLFKGLIFNNKTVYMIKK